MTVNPRSITDAERPWLDAWSLPVQVRLIKLVRERASNEIALSIAGWITAKEAGEDLAGVGARAAYRNILRGLAAEGFTPDPIEGVTSRSGRRVRGVASAASATLAVIGSAALASLYITDILGGRAGVAIARATVPPVM